MVRLRRSVSLLAFVVLSLLLFTNLASAEDPLPPNVTKAGQISALLPTAHIIRGTGNAKTDTVAAKGSELAWDDLVTTDKGGRARITLNDSSILSLGSQAQIRILKHDAASQQTAIELTYGRLRAEASKITKPDGSFKVNTPAAVAGVVGTDFVMDASGTQTNFVCLSGNVTVGSSNPGVGGSVSCLPGQFVSVLFGKPPSVPVPATQQQIQQALQATEPALASALAPGVVLQGSTINAVVAGVHLSKLTKVTVSGTGVSATILPGANDTSIPLQVTAAANAPADARVVTFSGTQVPSVSTVVTVLSQSAASGCTDVLNGTETSTEASMAALLDALDKNQKQGLADLQSKDTAARLQAVTTNVNTQMNAVTGAFEAAVDGDRAALTTALQQWQTWSMTNEVANSFSADRGAAAKTRECNALQASLNAVLQKGLTRFTAIFQQGSDTIATLILNELNSLTPSAPIAGGNLTANLGDQFQITDSHFQTGANTDLWSVCGNGNGTCVSIPGFNGSGASFTLDTCKLPAGDYRVQHKYATAADSVQLVDFLVHVQDVPSQPFDVLTGLASAYADRQPTSFMNFFDPSFAGYAALSENVRKTFPTLASMNMQLRPAQPTLNCNDAVIRTDWQQSYSFTSNPKQVFSQTEQLTVRFHRTPGKSWLITDLQGDNGTVQGTVPGPQSSGGDTALPELQVVGNITIGSSSGGGVDPRIVSRRYVLPGGGPSTLSATITNTSKVNLTTQIPVQFVLTDSTGNTLATANTVLPPLAAGASTTVTATLNVPNVHGVQANLAIIINPGCTIPTASCGSTTPSNSAVTIGSVDLQVASIQAPGVLNATLPGAITVAINNLGEIASTPATLLLTSDIAGFSKTATIPAIAAGGSTTVNFNFTVPDAAGNHGFTAAISPAAAGDHNPANDSLPQNFTIATGGVDLAVSVLAPKSVVLGTSPSYSLTVTNFGTLTSSPTRATCTGLIIGPSVGALAPGASATFTEALNPRSVGTSSITCSVPADPLEPASKTGNNSQTAQYTVVSPSELSMGSVDFGTTVLVAGSTGVTAKVNVSNFQGAGDAPAGWSVKIQLIDASLGTVDLGSAQGPALAAGTGTVLSIPLTVPANPSGQPFLRFDTYNALLSAPSGGFGGASGNIGYGDFTLTPIAPTGPVVTGRRFGMNVASYTPGNLPVTCCTVSGVSGTASIPLPQNTTGPVTVVLLGTGAGPGPFGVTVGATAGGVTKTTQVTLNALPDISLSLSSLTPFTLGGAQQTLTANVSGPFFPITVTLQPQNIAANGIQVVEALSTKVTGPGPVVWHISTGTVPSDGQLVVTATDGGNLQQGIPQGQATASTPYTVTGGANPHLTPTAITVTGHSAAPFTGSNGFQAGEVINFAASVANSGTAPATGSTMTLNVACGNQCGVTGSAGPMPGAGQSTQVALFGASVGPPGTRTGTVSIAPSPAGSAFTDTLSFNLDVFDFNIDALGSPRNVVSGRPAKFSIANFLGFGPGPYALSPISFNAQVSGSNTGLSLDGTGNYLLSGTAGPAGSASYTMSATVHGVTRSSFPVAVNVLPEITITPLNTQVGVAGVKPHTTLQFGQQLAVAVSGGVYPVLVTATLPSGFSTTASLTQTISAPATVTWPLNLASTVTDGNYPVSVEARDAGIASDGVPAGDVTLNTSITVSATLPDFFIGGNSFNLLNRPSTALTGPNSLQMGETGLALFQVVNDGANPPNGSTVTVKLSCPGCSNTMSATVAAPASGQLANVTFPVTVGTDLPLGSYTLTATLTTSTTQAGNFPNSTQTTVNVVDFTLTPISPPPVIVRGRSFGFVAATVNPLTYPDPVTFTASGLVTGITATPTPVNIVYSGTSAPSNPTVNTTITGAVHGVNRTTSVSITTQAEIAITQTGTPPSLTPNGASQPLSVSVTGGVYPVSLSIVPPAGIVNTGASIVTLTGPGVATWNIAALATAGGGPITVQVHATDAGISATTVPPGNVNFNASGSVVAPPDYVINSVTIFGRTTPFNGSSSFQVGETGSAVITIGNQGGTALGSPTVTATLTCTGCSSTMTASASAPAAGQTATITIPVTAGTDFPNGNYGASVAITSTATESNTSNNNFALSVNVVNFTLSAPSSTMLVTGRSFSFPAASLNPSTYPIPVTFGTSGLVTGINSSSNTLGVTFSGTSAPSGSVLTPVVTGTAHGVSRTASVPITLQPEIAMTQTVTPSVFPSGAAQTLSVSVTGGVYPVNLNLSVPAGLNISGPGTVILSSPGTASWLIQALPNAVAGPASVTILATDLGVSAANVPMGNVSFTASATVLALPDYYVSNASVFGRTPPFTGSNSFQVGETGTAVITIGNQGGTATGSPTVTATLSCTGCSSTLTATVAAPAAGQTATVNIPVTIGTDVPLGTTSGTLTLSTATTESDVSNNTNPVSMNVVDFSLTPASSPTIVTGRTFSFVGASVNPVTYPIPVTFTTAGLVTGMSATPNTSGVVFSGTAPAAVSAISVTGTANGVPRTTGVSVTVQPEIMMSQSSTPQIPPGSSNTLSVDVSGGVYPVTLSLSWPTTDLSVISGPNAITMSAPGTASWTIAASSTATLGPVTGTITATDGGISTTNTPAGNVVFSPTAQIGLPAVMPIVGPDSISFAPSIPKRGDNVDVRFRIKNPGKSDLHNIPIGLSAGGVIVARDSFDISAGQSTLAELQWQNAQPPSTGTAVSSEVRSGGSIGSKRLGTASPRFAIVIDPDGTQVSGKTTDPGRTIVISQLRFGDGGIGPRDSLASTQRVLIDVPDSACAGLRFASGPTRSCDSADVQFSVEDAGAGRYALVAQNGIVDLGSAELGDSPSAAGSFANKIPARPGHTYAVQLNNGQTSRFRIQAINSPYQLAGEAEKVFRANGVGRVLRGGPTTGRGNGTSETKRQDTVSFDVIYQP